MKKQLKAVISMLLALVLFVSAIPIGAVTASAAAKLTSKVTYENDGTAIVTLTAGDFYNTVRYTLDGTVPTEDSKLYVRPLEIKEKTLVRVAEFDDYGKRVKGIKLTVTPKSEVQTGTKTGKISFDVTQLGDYKAIVELDCETPDVEIRYTTDGTKPDENSELYENGIIIVEKTKIRARAYKEGYKTTTTYGKTISVKLFSDFDNEAYNSEKKDNDNKETVTNTEKKVEEKPEEPEEKTEESVEKVEEKTEEEKEPVKEVPVEKVYDNQKINYKLTYMDDGRTYVALTPAKNSYTIRYTTDGSTPSKESKKYSSRVKFEEPGVLRARQYNSKGQCVGTLKMNVKVKCKEITFTCVSIDAGVREIAMSCDTPGSTIYYSTNGISPKNGNGKKYTEPVFLSDYSEIMAYAAKDGYRDGSVAWDIAGCIKMKLDGFNFNDPELTEGINVLNRYMLQNGLHALTLDEKLSEAATYRALELSTVFSSKRPNGGSFASVIPEYGLYANIATEYIRKNDDTAREFIDGIFADGANAKKLLDSPYDYKTAGIGYYERGGMKYWSLILIAD